MFKWKIVANIAAGVLLTGGLAYYNFIDKPSVSSVEVGKECPNFIAKPYQVDDTGVFTASNDVFTLVNQRGKVCVVNFWETWCQACVEELPEFNQIQVEYGDKVEIIAVAGQTSTLEDAATWMTNKGWSVYDSVSDWADFSLTFAYLPTATCKIMGVSGMLPRTVIVDQEGIVIHEQDGAMTHADLKNILDTVV